MRNTWLILRTPGYISFYSTNSRRGVYATWLSTTLLGAEIGHHVQKLLGISDQVRGLQQQPRSSKSALRRFSYKPESLNAILLRTTDTQEIGPLANVKSLVKRCPELGVPSESLLDIISSRRLRWVAAGRRLCTGRTAHSAFVPTSRGDGIR